MYKSKNRPQKVIDLYNKLKELILDLGDDVECVVKKQTIGFKKDKFFVDLIIYDKGIGVVLNVKKGELDDYKDLCEDISQKGHWGNGDYRIWSNIVNDVDYIFHLIKDSYKNII